MKKKARTTNSTEEYASPALIVLAAGESRRMGGVKKEYLPLNGGTVLSECVKAFLNALEFKIIVITYTKDENSCRNALFSAPEIKNSGAEFVFVKGGSTRRESVFNALSAIENISAKKNVFHGGTPSVCGTPACGAPVSVVFIHDGARPFVSKKIILDTYNAALEFGAAVPGIDAVDTQKETDGNSFIKRHLERKSLKAVQTPQVFDFEKIFSAHKKVSLLEKTPGGREYTDDTEIWSDFADGGPVKIVEGSIENKKITFPEDADFASGTQKKEERTMIRVGLGYDKHLLEYGRKLMIGGLEIPFEKGEAGHSDGDALLHAIADALLGAAGLGDIGSFFPPEDAKWKDADSKELLKTVWDKIKEEGWHLENLDAVIALEKPKFLPYREKTIRSIAEILGVSENQVFVKAKTGEKTGDVGTGKVIEVWTTCLLCKTL